MERRALDGLPEGISRRTFSAEIRSGEGDSTGHLIGHAAVFNTITRIADWFDEFDELIAPGAFADSIQTDDVRALWNHNPDYVLGRNRSGTLTLAEDDRGLAFDNLHPQTQTILDLVVAPIVRKDVNQVSFAFGTLVAEWDWERQPVPLCTLRKLKLYDISPVTYAAYPTTDVSARTWAMVKEHRAMRESAPKELIAAARRRRGLTLLEREMEVLG